MAFPASCNLLLNNIRHYLRIRYHTFVWRRMTISNSPGESGSIRKYLRSRKECSSVGSLPLDGIKDEKASKVGENTYTFGHQGGHEKQLMDPSLARTPGKATSQN